MNGQAQLHRPQVRIFNTRAALTLNMAGQRAGKSQMIGINTGPYIINYPTLKGFIAANTYLQLTQSTLVKVFEIWKDLYFLTEYSAKTNPTGHYVIDKKPPPHFKRNETFKDYNNIISFWNGHVIYVGSLDNFKAHDGKEFAYAHLDETKDTKEEAVTSVILARLSQRGLFLDPYTDEILYIPDYAKPENAAMIEERELEGFNPVCIHTSPAIGQVEWLIKMFDLDKYEAEIRRKITGKTKSGKHDYFHKYFDNKLVVIFSTYLNAKNLPSNYIKGRIAVLSENEQMKFIYGYPFSKTGGEYFPRFDRLKHVTTVAHIPTLPDHLSWDFNVLPFMTMLCAQVQFVDRYHDKDTGRKYTEYKTGLDYLQVMQIRFYKEYTLEEPLNTVEHVCNAYIADHAGEANNGVMIYGDASGRNRVPGLGSYTNFKEVFKHLARYIHDGSDRVPKANIGIFSRRDLMNRIFEGKIPSVEIFIDEGMTNTIRDLEYLKLAVDGKLKERVKDAQTGRTYEKLGHCADALEYLVCTILKQFITE